MLYILCIIYYSVCVLLINNYFSLSFFITMCILLYTMCVCVVQGGTVLYNNIMHRIILIKTSMILKNNYLVNVNNNYCVSY